MYFNSLGLVTDDQGDQFLYIAWRHVHGLWKWMVDEGNSYKSYPGHAFKRTEVAFILNHYQDEMN